jgi:hypothetical protein
VVGECPCGRQSTHGRARQPHSAERQLDRFAAGFERENSWNTSVAAAPALAVNMAAVTVSRRLQSAQPDRRA